MSILNKKLSSTELATLDLFLSGALAPLTGYLSKADHVSVIQQNRLANGYLWPLPFTLQLSSGEKLQAQLAGRVALVDDEQRVIAEIETEEFYRLPAELAAQTGHPADQWHISGKIHPHAKVLHPTFNRIRHNTQSIQNKLETTTWRQVIAVHTTGEMNQQDMHQACTWLKQNGQQDGGILLQVSAGNGPLLHEQMRTLRANIRCNAAKRVTLSLLPETPALGLAQRLLLQARIAKNFGATSLMIGSAVPKHITRSVLRYRDELGLELIPARRSQLANNQQHAEAYGIAA